MVDITLFEFHLDDGTLTANAPFSRSGGEAESSTGDGARSLSAPSLPVEAVLLGLVVAAYLLKRRRGGGIDAETPERAPIGS